MTGDDQPPVVIVGAGTAGTQCAGALRQGGFRGAIVLAGDEAGLPYQRPPLSKAFLKRGAGDHPTLLRPAAFWNRQEVELRSDAVEAIEPEARTVRFASGETLAYRHLVLATGARNRPLPFPVAEAAEVARLRTVDDARAIRQILERPQLRLVLIGGGFIGLEIAAAARSHDADVTVIEAAGRVLERAASPELSVFLADIHARHGVRVLAGRNVTAVDRNASGYHVALGSGERLETEAVIAGVGVQPNVELAVGAGLAVDDGVVVDDRLLSSNSDISAIGDCVSFPCAVSGVRLRLESVQNATDQARSVAGRLCGSDAPYRATPWFWTDQYEYKIQIAGAVPRGAALVNIVRGSPAGADFSVGRYERDGRLMSVESVGRVADHIAARKLLASEIDVPPEAFQDVSRPLRQWLEAPTSGT